MIDILQTLITNNCFRTFLNNIASIHPNSSLYDLFERADLLHMFINFRTNPIHIFLNIFV